MNASMRLSLTLPSVGLECAHGKFDAGRRPVRARLIQVRAQNLDVLLVRVVLAVVIRELGACVSVIESARSLLRLRTMDWHVPGVGSIFAFSVSTPPIMPLGPSISATLIVPPPAVWPPGTSSWSAPSWTRTFLYDATGEVPSLARDPLCQPSAMPSPYCESQSGPVAVPESDVVAKSALMRCRKYALLYCVSV
jgi:hypothetical protein